MVEADPALIGRLRDNLAGFLLLLLLLAASPTTPPRRSCLPPS
jgi:hypothetical protein